MHCSNGLAEHEGYFLRAVDQAKSKGVEKCEWEASRKQALDIMYLASSICAKPIYLSPQLTHQSTQSLQRRINLIYIATTIADKQPRLRRPSIQGRETK